MDDLIEKIEAKKMEVQAVEDLINGNRVERFRLKSEHNRLQDEGNRLRSELVQLRQDYVSMILAAKK